jgi:methionyl-tRNA formyltransferase
MNTVPSFAFFGTGPLAESVLASLVRNGYSPSLIITKPDAHVGRHGTLTAPHIKVWGEMKGISVYQPETLRDLPEDSPLLAEKFSFFVVASYGKILPEKVLDLAEHGTLNVHPSLLPLYRGPSPIESALLDGADTLGVTIMKLDSDVDHGPILVQSLLPIDKRDNSLTLEVKAGIEGGELLSKCLPHFLDGTLLPKVQDHSRATFCKKIEKEMGEVSLEDSSKDIFKKWQALTPWPGVFFFIARSGQKLRIKISEIDVNKVHDDVSAKDCITKVIPEGKKEISFQDFARGYLLG